MSSTSIETRKKQKEQAETAWKARQASLSESGVTAKDQGKDPMLRKLMAKLKKVKQQLSAIEARDSHVKKVAEEKKAKASGKSQKGKGKGQGKGKGKGKGKKEGKKEKKKK